MWRQRLEYRAREVIEQAQAREAIEDSLVELKREWPTPAKAGRRIAAHANAARGEEILWLIGIDEKSGRIHSVEPEELANWWPQVQLCFDEGVSPLMRQIFIGTPQGRVAALFFETDNAPYVIRVPEDPVTREVPWRDGTRTRTARRSELLKVLIPAVSVPAATVVSLRAMAERIEPKSASSTYGIQAEEEHVSIRIHGKVYIDPPTELIVLPDHAMTGRVDWNPRGSRRSAPPETALVPRLSNEYYFTAQGTHRVEAHPLGIEHRHGSVYVNGAGEMELEASGSLEAEYATAVRRTKLLRVFLGFPVAGGFGAIRAAALLEAAPWPTDMGRKERSEDLGVWSLRE
jgi:hypothetical protein